MKIHIVKKGDTLYLIAQKYNVSLEEIIKLNPEITNPDQIDIGMKVKVPTGSNHHNGQMDIMHQHVVQQGDTLWKLSKAWGVPLGDMIKANPQLKNPNVLLTGEIVNIPKPGSSGMMMHEMSENAGKGTGHNPLSPSSVMQGVQGLMSKIPTGKKPTGQKPSTMPMPIPEVLPEAVEPTPIPEPVPTPLPAPVPVVEKKYPVYHAQQHVDLFKQYGVPATEVMSLYDMPKMPEAVSPASQGPMKHGYGFSNPTVVSPAMTSGYGMNPTAVSPAMTGGYGNPTAVSPESTGSGYGFPTAVSPASTGSGYGFPTAVSPASTGGGYGFDMGPTAVSPAQEGPEWGPPMTLPWGAPSYGYNPSMVSPAEMGPQGGYGFNPSMVSPAEMGPQGGYGFNPSMVSPAEMGPQGGYGYGFDPSMVSPANVGPQGGYGYGGYDHSMVSPANVGPQGGYGYGGYDPSMVSPANMGPQGYTYMGNGQVSPLVAGANDKDCNCGCREDEEELADEEGIEMNSPKAKVARKKKPVIRTVRKTKPKRRGSYPWINQ